MAYWCCAICEKEIPINDAREFRFFCWKCYALWQDSIIDKEAWIIYLVNEEQKRRYRLKDMAKHNIKEPISLSRINLDRLNRRVFVRDG